MKIKSILLGGAFSLFAATAMAAPVTLTSNDATNLQDELNAITTGGVSSIDVTTDFLSDELDSYWAIGGSGGSISTFVFEIAGNSSLNTFGIYDRQNPAEIVQIFSGGDTGGAQVRVSILASGMVQLDGDDTGTIFANNNFGFYLGRYDAQTDTPSALFYSDTELNNGEDMMAAYQGNGIDEIQILPFAAGIWSDNEYLLAWEDQFGGDDDFNDLVVMVESVNPVSNPAAISVLGAGILLLVARRRLTGRFSK